MSHIIVKKREGVTSLFFFISVVSTPSPRANAGASAGESIGVERNISYELGARYFAPESFFILGHVGSRAE